MVPLSPTPLDPILLSPALGWAALCGIGLGVGLWSLASMLPRLSRPRLVDRVAPYVVDVSEGARSLLARRSIEPLPVLGSLFSPLFIRTRGGLDRLLGGTATIQKRLRQSGSTLTVEGFRSRQLLWALCGAGLGIGVSFVAGFSAGAPFGLQVLVVIIGTAGGVIGRDHLLQRTATARIARITSELPTVLEFLTLSLSAGEGILDALRRVGAAGSGELAAEFRGVVTAVNTGLPLGDSLTTMANGLQLPALTRTVDHIVGALERGTPLADVLRAQAQDSREIAKRDLLELAGKKEVAMLVPLVFLILPLTIVFAIFPGIVVLQLGL